MKTNPSKAFDYIFEFTSKRRFIVDSKYKDDHYGMTVAFKRGPLLCQSLSGGGRSVAFNGKIAVTDAHGGMAYLGGMTPERLCHAAKKIEARVKEIG